MRTCCAAGAKHLQPRLAAAMRVPWWLSGLKRLGRLGQLGSRVCLVLCLQGKSRLHQLLQLVGRGALLHALLNQLQ